MLASNHTDVMWHILSLQVPNKCSVGLRSVDCGGQSTAVRSPWSSLVFKLFCLSFDFDFWPDLNIPIMFTCRFETLCCFPINLLTNTLLLLSLSSNLDSSVTGLFQSSTVKFWYFLAELRCLALFPLLGCLLETATGSPQGKLLLTVLLSYIHLLF